MTLAPTLQRLDYNPLPLAAKLQPPKLPPVYKILVAIGFSLIWVAAWISF